MAQQSLDTLSLDIRSAPEVVVDGDNAVKSLLGWAQVTLPPESDGLGHLESIEEPEAERLAEIGWTYLQLRADLTFYDPTQAAKVSRRYNGQNLGPVLNLLNEKIGIQDRLRAAKRIGLKYVTENPAVDISWLPEEIIKPKNAFLTIQSETDGNYSAEGREETVVVMEDKRTWRHRVEHGIGSFFFSDGGHPGLGEPVDLVDSVSAEELDLLTQLFGRFHQASRALVAAAVNDTFSITPPTADELWTTPIT